VKKYLNTFVYLLSYCVTNNNKISKFKLLNHGGMITNDIIIARS